MVLISAVYLAFRGQGQLRGSGFTGGVGREVRLERLRRGKEERKVVYLPRSSLCGEGEEQGAS